MKILHISHGQLPDARVEKNAKVMADRGHELFFIGGKLSERCEPFQQVETIYMNDLNVLITKLMWCKKIRKIAPDVIHAHDIMAVRVTFGLGLPVVYDDHEWWSRNYPIWFGVRNIIRKVMSLPVYLMVPRWERKALTSYATLTMSGPVADSHRRQYDAWIETTENYPAILDVIGITPARPLRNGCVYSGSDVIRRVGARRPAAYRDMTELPDSVKFDKVYGLSYRDMLAELMCYKVGLIPWKCHPMHHYASPAKAYDYLHAGLQVVAPRTMTALHGLPFVYFFDSLDEIPDILESIPDVDPYEIKAWALKNVVWNVHTPVILQAYEEAFRRFEDGH